ncbi:hypothetical protein [Taibaiella koreensis]|uniref:hypothetical protein n=1 Tax=Taibaiella koreensis TaxID=1268548 RepID=UPI000E5A087E|nr:hypothetical protein [Taibaiella koreensis]
MAVKFESGTAQTTDNAGKQRLLSYNRLYKFDITEDSGIVTYKEGLETTSSLPDLLSPARKIARQYLKTVVDEDEMTIEPDKGLWDSARPGASLAEQGEALPYFRFKEEKTVGNVASVAYEQLVDDIPVWGAGLFVRINPDKGGVSGFHNGAHYIAGIHRANPEKIAAWKDLQQFPLEKLMEALGATETVKITHITDAKVWFYQYLSEKRMDGDELVYKVYVPGKNGEAGVYQKKIFFAPPALSEEIRDGIHYESVEVLFSVLAEGESECHWRAFIEPDSNRVLFLESFRAYCANAAVFESGPVSVTRGGVRDLALVSGLDKECAMVPLKELAPPNCCGIQQLAGKWVVLGECHDPSKKAPRLSPPYNFVYPFDSYEFAACSAYYHCDSMFRLIEALGFKKEQYFEHTDFPVTVDPVMYGEDACTDQVGKGKGIAGFAFGVIIKGEDRGVGLSTDIRVVRHEFGHAALISHIGLRSFSFSHGIGDTFAAVLGDPLNDALDRFETFPFTYCILNRRHDRDPAKGWNWFGRKWSKGYEGEEILSTTLFRAYRAAGGDSSHFAEKEYASRYLFYLMLKAIGSLLFHENNSVIDDLDELVGALGEADLNTDDQEGHPGGLWSKVFIWSFGVQGLYNPAGYQVQPGFEQVMLPADFVDVFIDDGRRGGYLPYLENLTTSPGIWNRLAPDVKEGNQKPVPGVMNYAFVMIRNKGTRIASNIKVSCYRAIDGTPVYWSETEWEPLWENVQQCRTIAPDKEDYLIAGPFEWIPKSVDDVLLFSVSTPDDKSNLEGDNGALREFKTDPLVRRLVVLDNNIAMRKFNETNFY